MVLGLQVHVEFLNVEHKVPSRLQKDITNCVRGGAVNVELSPESHPYCPFENTPCGYASGNNGRNFEGGPVSVTFGGSNPSLTVC